MWFQMVFCHLFWFVRDMSEGKLGVISDSLVAKKVKEKEEKNPVLGRGGKWEFCCLCVCLSKLELDEKNIASGTTFLFQWIFDC